MKGTIALDIDGTITAEKHRLPSAVSAYLSVVARLGWRIVFITGRTFSWGYTVLEKLDFPYYFAVQNGAVILEMPARKLVAKKYLDGSVFFKMDEVCRDEDTDFVIYAGVEYGDVCYFRPEYFSQNLLSYVRQRTAALKESWLPVDSYATIGISEFPSIKCFGSREAAFRISEKIRRSLALSAPPISDPYDRNYFVVQATHASICKGQALQDLAKLTGGLGKVIAAGDDLNDLTMLATADIKIVMANAPPEMLKIADIVAPPASEEGIIKGLQQALACV